MSAKRKRTEQQRYTENERRKFRRENIPNFAEKQRRKDKNRQHEYKRIRNENRSNSLGIMNQMIFNYNDEEERDVQSLSALYQEDAREYLDKINPATEICAVCGIGFSKTSLKRLPKKHSLFDTLKTEEIEEGKGSWVGYFENKTSSEVFVCEKCLTPLKKNEVPKFSRVNIPIFFPSETLRSLSYLETLLISPILPITYAWQHRSYGQYKTKGQCVAFMNNLPEIAKHLPRHPTEVVIIINKVYGWDERIRINYIKNAFYELKFIFKHPAFVDILYSDVNAKAIEDFNIKADNQRVEKEDNVLEKSSDWSKVLVDRGQNQCIEGNVASTLLGAPVCLHEDHTSQEAFKSKIIKFFESLRDYSRPLHYPDKIADWSSLFPTLMPDGNGGPLAEYKSITVKEWVQYVIQITDQGFHSNIPFLFYSNFTLRKQRITGVSACKPIAKSVASAIDELVRIAKDRQKRMMTPRSTITYLANQVSFHTSNLPGSVGDMSEFRKNILSMIFKHGRPTFFMTLSSADTMWPETFVFISGHKISIDQAKKLSSKERGKLIAENPVRTTIAWKTRLQAIIDFICKGKTKPVGNIEQYAIKAEWQMRCSEHVHMLIWSDAGIPELQKNLMSMERKFFLIIQCF